MRGPLFEVNVNQFIKHVEATPYQLIWEANKGLLRLIAEYFGFLFTMFFPGVGYFGVFLEVGFTGVLRQVVEQELLDQILGRLSEYSSSSGAGPGSGDFNWLSILLSGKKAGANLAKKVERQVLTDERQAAARMIEGENRAIDSRAADQVEGTAHAADHEQAERLLERRAEVAEAPPTPTRDGSILTVGESRIGVHEQYTDFRIGESRIGAHERSVGAPVEQHGAVTAQEIAALQEAEASLLARKLKLEKELRQKNSNLLGESKQWDFAQENGATQHELERLEQKYDARRKQYDAVEEQLHNLNEELAHVQARIEREFPATAQPLQLRRGIKREPEIAEAFGLGPKNNQTLREKGSDRPGFRPDHVDGNPVRLRWGASYHFREIKDWADMSDTGNLKAMLDYVADPKNKSSLTIYYRSNTKMTGPLREKISDLFFKGKVELVPFVGE